MAFVNVGEAYKDLWIATESDRDRKIQDMLPRAHPLLSKIAGGNHIRGSKLVKGKRFVETILARSVDTVKSIMPTDEISTDTAQLLEVIEVEPKLIYSGVTLYDHLMSVNDAGELVDLMQINERGVREGLTRAFAKSLYETGLQPTTTGYTFGTAMNGIPYMISDNPYASGLIVYNLQRGFGTTETTPGGAHEFWRNRVGNYFKSGTGANWPTTQDAQADALISALTMMVLTLGAVSDSGNTSVDNAVIDGIFMNYYFYNLFQYARYQRLHINNVNEQKVDMGFVKLEHMGIPVYLDKNCPINKIYFVDSSQIELLYVEGENFKHQVKEIPTYFAKRYITTFQGNYIIHKARNCGVITLTDTAVSLPADCNVCNPDVYVDYDYPQPAQATDTAETFENTGYSGSGEPVPTAPTEETIVKGKVKDASERIAEVKAKYAENAKKYADKAYETDKKN